MFPHPAPLRHGLGWLALACCLVAAVPAEHAHAVDLKQRSVSASKQFTVFCEDARLRSRVASFADEVKSGVLQMLGESDGWRQPILLVLEQAPTGQPIANPVQLSLIQHEVGFKVQINVRIGLNPSEVNLQKHLVRAIFLEMAYRTCPERIQDGQAFVEAPWWLVEGTLQYLRTRDRGQDADFYKRMLAVNRLPPLKELLQPREAAGADGSAALAVDSACAVCLVELLLEQPLGKASLGRFVRHLPEPTPSLEAALAREFPQLAAKAGDLQKWWTVSLARLSAADRFKGLSPEETDAQLAGQLQLEIEGKDGVKRSYGVADFGQYLKLPKAKEVLEAQQTALRDLSANANALYREIVGEYEQIFGALARGKTWGVKGRLEKVARYREALLTRRGEIADYLNWYEATQMAESSGTFDGYMRAANELGTPARSEDPISRYLDEISQEL